jgi:hypothetical protein
MHHSLGSFLTVRTAEGIFIAELVCCVHFVPAVAVGTTTVLPKYVIGNKYSFARIFVVAVVYNAYLVETQFCIIIHRPSQSQWSCILRRVSAAVCLLGLRVRIPQGHGCVSLVSVVQVQASATGRSPG